MWSISSIARDTTLPAYYGGFLWKTYALLAILYAADIIEWSNTTVMAIERIQREFSRKLTNMPFHTKISVLYAETGLRPIRYSIIQSTLSYWTRAMSLGEESVVKQALLAQISYFRQKRWDYFQPPDESWADNTDYRNTHFWLKRAIDAAEAVDISLEWVYTKQAIKRAVDELWAMVFWESTNTSRSLTYYSGRRERPLVDKRLRLRTPAKWWLKFRAGVLIPPLRIDKQCRCGGLITQEHIIWACPELTRNYAGLLALVDQEGDELGVNIPRDDSEPQLKSTYWTD